MKCQEVIELIQRHLDHDLSDEESTSLQEHLQSCTECTMIHERLQHLSEELVNLPKVEPAYSLVDAIMPKLDELNKEKMMERTPKPSSPQTGLRSKRFKYFSGVVAAAVIGCLIYLSLPTGMQTADDHANQQADVDFMFSSTSTDLNHSGEEVQSRVMMDESTSDENIRTNQKTEVFTHESTATESPTARQDQAKASPMENAEEAVSTNNEVDSSHHGAGNAENPPLAAAHDNDLNDRMQVKGTSGLAVADEKTSLQAATEDGMLTTHAVYDVDGYYVLVTDLEQQIVFESDKVEATDALSLTWGEDDTRVIFTYVIGEEEWQMTIDLDNRTEVITRKD